MIIRGALFTEKLLLISEPFASRYLANVEHFTDKANAGKIGDFIDKHFNDKLAAATEIYNFDGVDAHIRIEGPMSPNGPDLYDIFYGYGGVSYARIIEGVEQAKSDVNPKTGKLYLHTNTPGGTVSMVDDVHQAIATSGLEVVMLNNDLVASGGMWLGSACSEIVATTPVAFTGSIGVVITCYDFSGMLEKFGIKRHVITNHEASEKIPDISTPEGRKVIQQELDAIYGIFKQRVVEGRGGKISADAVDALKGSVVVASDALKVGLIDRIDGMSSSRVKKQTRAQAIAEPADKGATAMNIEQLKAEHPDLVAAIVAEAREGMVTAADHESATATARAEGAESERARIAEVRAQSIAGHEELVEQMAFDGKSTGADAALAIVAAEKAKGAQAAADADADANEPVAPVDGSGGPAKTMKLAAFNALGQQEQREFIKSGGKVAD